METSDEYLFESYWGTSLDEEEEIAKALQKAENEFEYEEERRNK